jgi:radial spoke head protein 1
MNGSGTLLYPDGTYYDGMFVYGLKNGPGILFMPNGDKIEGEFVNNQIGKATYTKGAFTPVSRYLGMTILFN